LKICKSGIERHYKYLKTFIGPEILLGSQRTSATHWRGTDVLESK